MCRPEGGKDKQVCRPEGGEDKQVCRPEGGEDERESWDSKLTFLLAMLLALEMSGFSSTYPRIIWVVVILVLFIVVTGFVERLVQFTTGSVSHALQ